MDITSWFGELFDSSSDPIYDDIGNSIEGEDRLDILETTEIDQTRLGVLFENRPRGEEYSAMVGDPMQDAMHYHAQTYSDTCAIVSQQGILKQFNIELTETDLRDYATAQGWYEPGGGTPLSDVGNLLEAAGIKTHRVIDASLSDIETELQSGHKVIVGLDANEVWTPERGLNPFNWWRAELPDAGHAIWVTGVDREAGLVYMNDSGHYHGQARVVKIEDFRNAWQDFGNYYCATNEAPSTA